MRVIDRGYRVLMVEDDEEISRHIETYLSEQEFQVTVLARGHQVLGQLAEEKYDLILLDLNLPDADGLDLIPQIRAGGHTPILVMSARSGGQVRIKALSLGANDFLSKPFSLSELISKAEGLLSSDTIRSAFNTEGNGYQLQMDGRRVSMLGSSVELSLQEFALLEALVHNPGRVMTREELLSKAWDAKYHGNPRRVDLCAERLRAKLSSLDDNAPGVSCSADGLSIIFRN